jgi:SAM-dependent methyltransferase
LYVTPRPADNELVTAHECGVHGGQTVIDMTGCWDASKIPRYLTALKDLYGNDLGTRDRTWLDIGCGHGEFLTALNSVSERRTSGEGLEPNENKRKSAQNRGLKVDYFDLSTHDKQYDVVSLLNVYSHLPNPPEFFRLCKKLLKSGGEVLIETGDTAYLPSEKHFKPFYLPDHLSFASEKIVTELLRRCGFVIISVRKYPAFIFEWHMRNVPQTLKEMIKVVYPGKRSNFGAIFKSTLEEYRRSSRARKHMTDMYIRAKAL